MKMRLNYSKHGSSRWRLNLGETIFRILAHGILSDWRPRLRSAAGLPKPPATGATKCRRDCSPTRRAGRVRWRGGRLNSRTEGVSLSPARSSIEHFTMRTPLRPARLEDFDYCACLYCEGMENHQGIEPEYGGSGRRLTPALGRDAGSHQHARWGGRRLVAELRER